MPPRLKLDAVRAKHAQDRKATAQRLAELAAAEAVVAALARSGDPGLAAARAARDAASTAWKAARDAERTSRDRVQLELGRWLTNFRGNQLSEAAVLSTALPILLLPVRLQTRWLPVGAPTELFIRIYPDDIFADTHEPALTAEECDAGIDFWTAGWQPAGEADAWRALVRRFTPPRAAHIVVATTPTNLAGRAAQPPVFPMTDERPAAWTRPAEARVLPDRFVAIASRGGVEIRRGVGGPVRDPLALTLDPAESDPARQIDVSGNGLVLDTDLAWTVDFKAAERAGMALRMPVDATDVASGFDELLVIGVKASVDPPEAATRVADLLRGHRFDRGLALVPQGTPTNNTADGLAGFGAEDAGGASSFAVERTGLAVSSETDGPRLLRALGLSKRLADDATHIPGADRRENVLAGVMAEALWPVTLGYYLAQMLDPGVSPAARAAVHDHYVAHVRGRGPLAALRIGPTPYGVVPVSSLTRWNPNVAGPGLATRLPAILTLLREPWRAAARRVTRVGDGADGEAELLDVLGLDASMREARVRVAAGPDVITNLFQLYGSDFFGATAGFPAWIQARRDVAARVRAVLAAAGWQTAGDPRVGRLALRSAAYRFRHTLVAPPPLSERDALPPFNAPIGPKARNYVEWVARASIAALRVPQPVESPPLLFLLLREAMLLVLVDNAFDVLVQNGLASDADRREPELIGIPLASGNIRRPIWDWLATPIPALGGRPLADLLDAGRRVETRRTDSYRQLLAPLANTPSAELERLLGETLDTASHRLDAWITSLSTSRLAVMRAAHSEDCHLGAYGWVERVRPARGATARVLPDGRTVYTQAGSGGRVQAPSLAHAGTAAVLRSGYMNRAAEAKKPFALDLSSARTRAALSLLDAVREGQMLGAVLGYQFERQLHDRSLSSGANLERFIDPLRSRFPLVFGKGDPAAGAAQPGAVARTVVDGLALWKAATPFGNLGATAAELADLQSVRADLAARIDAAADLLLAESVHQAVLGNAVMTGASVEAMAGGARPPDPEVARTPRTGTTILHRVAVILGSKPATLPDGWPADATPRAAAEPYLDAWVGALIGDPRTVTCVVHVSGGGAVVDTRISLADLGVRPIDVLALAAGPSAELDRRVVAGVPVPQGGAIEIGYGAEPGANPRQKRSFADVLELARLIGELVGRSRPLRAEDLVPPDESGAAAAGALPADAAARAADVLVSLDAAAKNLGVAIAAADPTSASTISDLAASMRRASLFGLPSAYPDDRAPPELLVAQARAAHDELARRTTEAAGKDAAAAMVAVFGRGFVFLPRFQPTSPAELDLALAATPTLIAADTQAPRRWLAQLARVRAPLASWRHLGLAATALGTGLGGVEIAQLPYRPGATWIGLPFGANPAPTARLSLALRRVAAPSAGDAWVGLLVDAWSEVVPNAIESAALAFHYDDPAAEAPQALLLAVPPDPTAASWDGPTLVEVIRESFELARLRAVAPELLDDLGQLLPTTYVAANPANDAVAARLDVMGDPAP